MLLSIKNLGKIETANIEINGITIIAGENNSGKSTVGKTLFCIFNSFYKIDSRIEAERFSAVSREIESAYYYNVSGRFAQRFDVDELAETIMANKNMYVNDELSLQQDIKNFLIQNDPNFEKHLEKTKLDSVAEKIVRIFNISDDEVLTTILRKKMQAEFNMQINNLHDINTISEIMLKIKDTDITIRVKNNKDINISNNLSLDTEVIYIDNPYAMDNLRYPLAKHQNRNYSTHREHLTMCLADIKVKGALDEIIASKKLDKVLEKLNTVCSGKIVRNNRSFAYMENSDVSIDIVNVSTGLKTFAIIKTLLLNGSLEENGSIVLDEPEIHLHPEWQLIFAELIVLIQKEFNMHILINTHSPYFLDAVEVYSHKHGIASKCKYYLAEVSGTTSVISDVSNNIEKIYEKLARPLQVLENERYSDD